MTITNENTERLPRRRRKWFDSERFSERAQGVGRPLSERLWEKIDKKGPDECWEWQGALDSGGYGHIADESGRARKAHRLVLKTMGLVLGSLHVCHSCDNPRCCNPNHLFLGSHRDNVQDRHTKGRTVIPSPKPGEKNPQAKLSSSEVNDIRWLYAANHPPRDLSQMFGVSKSTIRLIVRREIWRHIP